MLDTAAGGTLLRKETWEALALEEGGGEEEVVQMAGPGAGGGVSARKVSINLYLGGTSVREGHQMTMGAAVLFGGGKEGEGGKEGGGEGGEWSSSERFDGILGQSFFGSYEVVDFDWRHAMLRCYERGREGEGEGGREGGVELEGLLDYWPVPSSATVGAARLTRGVATDLLGPNSLVSVSVVLNNQMNTPIVGLLDTGAQTSVLNWAAARALGIEGGRDGGKAGGNAKESQIVALGLDGKPVKLMYAKFDEVAFEGGREGGKEEGVVVVQKHTGGKNLAIADLPGLEKLGLLDTPAMIVGLDLVEGGRGGRLVLDMKGGKLYVA